MTEQRPSDADSTAPAAERRRKASATRIGHRQAVSVLGLFLLWAGPRAAHANKTDARWVVVPFPVYAPETDVQMTLTAMGHFRRADGAEPPSSLLANVAYTQRKQTSVSLAPHWVSRNGAVQALGKASFRDWPDKFYGVGHDTPERAEEDFSARTIGAFATVRAAVFARWQVGLRGEFSDARVRQTEAGGQLADGSIPGSESARVAGLGLVATWDSRDNLFHPERGVYAELSATDFGSGLGDHAFRRVRLDARQYFPVRPFGTLALQQHVNWLDGNVPFLELSRIGDIRFGEINLMRGYYSGRFRDRHAAVLQSEWRFPLRGKIGATLFGGLGAIGANLLDTDERGVYPNGGVGFRYRARESERVNLRLDIAFGERTSGVYFGILEAF